LIVTIELAFRELTDKVDMKVVALKREHEPIELRQYEILLDDISDGRTT
jgi:hypothetical protein